VAINATSRERVRVLKWNGNVWVQRGADIDGEAGGRVSESVSLSSDGTVVAIGAPGNDGNGRNSGQVRVFEWNGSEWIQRGLVIDGEAAGDRSGFPVSLSSDGTIVAIGATGNDGNGDGSGHVRLYKWNGSVWIQRGADIDGEAAGDQSGSSVSLSSDGSVVVIGASGNDGNGRNSGHVRVFTYGKFTVITEQSRSSGATSKTILTSPAACCSSYYRTTELETPASPIETNSPSTSPTKGSTAVPNILATVVPNSEPTLAPLSVGSKKGTSKGSKKGMSKGSKKGMSKGSKKGKSKGSMKGMSNGFMKGMSKGMGGKGKGGPSKGSSSSSSSKGSSSKGYY